MNIERRLLFSRFRHQIGAENIAREKAAREQSAAKITAENREHLETLKTHFDALGLDDYFEQTRHDLIERSEQLPLRDQLDLDIWRINYSTPGRSFTEETAVRALTGFVIQVRKPKTYPESSWITPNTTFYALLFQPSSNFVAIGEKMEEISSSPPMIFIGSEPEGLSANNPTLSEILGVDRAMKKRAFAKMKHDSSALWQNSFLSAKEEFGHKVDESEKPKPFDWPKIVEISERTLLDQTFIDFVDGNEDSLANPVSNSSLDHLFSVTKVTKRFKRPSIVRGSFRKASQTFNPDSSTMYRDQASTELLKFLQSFPDFTPYDSPARAIDELP
jgi:hypothetical protein